MTAKDAYQNLQRHHRGALPQHLFEALAAIVAEIEALKSNLTPAQREDFLRTIEAERKAALTAYP